MKNTIDPLQFEKNISYEYYKEKLRIGPGSWLFITITEGIWRLYENDFEIKFYSKNSESVD